MKQKLFGFWHYDKFPYCKGDNIEFFDERGRIAVENNPSSMFTPFLIIPIADAHQIIGELNELTNLYEESKQLLKEDFEKRIQEIIKIP